MVAVAVPRGANRGSSARRTRGTTAPRRAISTKSTPRLERPALTIVAMAWRYIAPASSASMGSRRRAAQRHRRRVACVAANTACRARDHLDLPARPTSSVGFASADANSASPRRRMSPPRGARPRRPGRARRGGGDHGERCGALEHGGGGGEPATTASAPGRLFQGAGDVLIRSGRAARAVPSLAIRVRVRVGRSGERSVCGLALAERRAPYTADRTSGCRNHTRTPISTNPASIAGVVLCASTPRSIAARHTTSGSPVGSAAATVRKRCVASGS